MPCTNTFPSNVYAKLIPVENKNDRKRNGKDEINMVGEEERMNK